VIFIDRSVPRGVADAVKRMREDVLWLEDRFPHDVPDTEWLTTAGEEGWPVRMVCSESTFAAGPASSNPALRTRR
jgi:hypothetical protein